MYLNHNSFQFLIRSLVIQGLFLYPVFASSNHFSIDQISKHPQWRELHRYRQGFWGIETEEDGKNFFYSDQGKQDPKKELQAFLKEIKKPIETNSIDKHAFCEFPARFLFLKSQGVEFSSEYKLERCIEYQKFRKKIRPTAVSIEFSSYYMNRPASAFGHTLLRFSKRGLDKDARQFELLDYGLNYSATVTTNNSFLYGIMGLFGGFKGQFATMPYFYKVREYSDFESRDLWIYELNLNTSQIDFLVAHTWEMGKAEFSYYYLDENCSYHILALLNAVNPDWNLIKPLRKFIIPADTIKSLTNNKDLVKNIHFRPSGHKKFLTQKKQLNPREKKVLEKIIQSRFTDFNQQMLTNNSFLKVLDTAISYIDYQYAKEVLEEEKEISKLKSNLLIKRSKIPIRSQKIEVTPPMSEAPHLGHGSRRAGLNFYDHKNISHAYEFEFRFAYHDILDNHFGLSPYSQVEIGHFKLNYFQNKLRGNNFYFKSFYLAEILNLVPVNFYDRNLSFKFKVGFQRPFDNECLNCSVFETHIGVGYTFKLYHYLFYALINTTPQYGASFLKNDFRLSYGPEIGALFPFSNYFKLRLNYQYKLYSFSTLKRSSIYGADLQINPVKFYSLGASFNKSNDHEEYIIRNLFFF